jgi:hypothetical protein
VCTDDYDIHIMRSIYTSTLNFSSEDLEESIITKTSVLQCASDCTSAVHLASAITVSDWRQPPAPSAYIYYGTRRAQQHRVTWS